MAEDTTTTEERPEQTVTVEDAGPACKRLKIELPESRINAKIEEAYGNLQDEAVLPGFRRGRAPRRLLEKRFATSIRDDVKGQLLSEAYTQAIEDEKLDVLGEPDVKDVENIQLPETGPLAFEVEVEISPTVTLPDFSKLKIEKPSAEVTEDAIEKELEQYRERAGRMTTVEDATIAEGDFVQTDAKVLAGKDAGEDAEVLDNRPDAHVLVNGKDQDFKGHAAGILIPDLGKKLVGKKVGDEVTISMTGPKSHENEKIKDQPITIKLNLKQVQRVEPASIEELVEQAGAENEQALRDRLRQMMEQRAKREQQTAMHKQVTDQLADLVDLELPEGITSRQTERALQRRRMELAYQGKTMEEIEAATAEMRSESEETARNELKQFFILDQAAKDLDIEVNQAEINSQIAMMAMQQGRRPEKLRQEMRQRGELDHLYMQIREQKTLDKILESTSAADDDQPTDQPESPADKKKKKTKSTKKPKKDAPSQQSDAT